MPRKLSSIAPDWWDYTTLEPELIREAAALTPEKMARLSRRGFKVVLYDTLEEFYLAEALEYVTAWSRSTPDNPVGICGPIGPRSIRRAYARAIGIPIAVTGTAISATMGIRKGLMNIATLSSYRDCR